MERKVLRKMPKMRGVRPIYFHPFRDMLSVCKEGGCTGGPLEDNTEPHTCLHHTTKTQNASPMSISEQIHRAPLAMRVLKTL
jgi:hypothetical protein